MKVHHNSGTSNKIYKLHIITKQKGLHKSAFQEFSHHVCIGYI